MARDQALSIMARLGAQPAVAFYEGGVASAISAILSEMPLPFSVDEFGNIIVRVPGRSSEVPPLALVAHMDHPGFEAVAVHDGYLVGEALGGVPESSFDKGVPLQVVLADGQRLSAETAGRYGDESERKVLIKLDQPREVALPCSVVFDLPDFQLDGDIIRMRAVDDLAGCGSNLSV
ncbi:MAG: hypothetical protein IIB89_10635, partial [Chloroflexi bacterium]|nr:hypothetical protein [Chloroflexota bacterium]